MVSATGCQGGGDTLRRRLLAAIAATAVPAVALALAACTVGDGSGVSASITPTSEVRDDAASTDPKSPGTPGLVMQDAAVWYDDAGLHRDDVVEKTAVPLADPTSDRGSHLSLVRTGALYLDPVNDDVWFHPWGGEPRVVGSGSAAGPGGDPEGDLSAWFEGDELVVYDTVDGAEVARVITASVADSPGGEHHAGGNGFLQVSSDAVVWKSMRGQVLRLDLGTGEITDQTDGFEGERYLHPDTDLPASLWDVHDETEIWSWGDPGIFGILGIRAPGTAPQALPEFESQAGRLSPDGRFLLGVTTRHQSGFLNTTTREVFTLPEAQNDIQVYPFVAWSYGNTALIIVEGAPDVLHACDAVQRVCKTLLVAGGIILPAS